MASQNSGPAGIVTRGIAGAIDLGVVLALMGSGYAGVAFVRLLFSPQTFTFTQPGIFLSTTAFLVVSIGYLTVCWATTGRTVGALVMGLRVVKSRHRLIRWPLALIRAVLCTLFAFGLLWAAVDKRRRSLQDIVLRTAVVYDWSQDPDIVVTHGVEES
ncbi:hypothetical protein B2J88_37710 [Rhodococcus sp. SRB_17]|uniref:RDD family protein n=1 Tax=Rhodococcus sp. OK302 TaxID=1882769 RepID=UPI000B9403BC|nr:RDD family protein [Rhodococcus sp. OK302]NMM90012.1 hypothetical protein [Rhodococcus sp. SRB_17]OYD68570.1 putative RDD family membrane protein YckC [Rhodococcus sp. OK302]